MAISTWADSLISVYKHRKEEIKNHLHQIRNQITPIEREIEELQILICNEGSRTSELVTRTVCPQIFLQISGYCQLIYQKIALLVKSLQQLKKWTLPQEQRFYLP